MWEFGSHVPTYQPTSWRSKKVTQMILSAGRRIANQLFFLSRQRQKKNRKEERKAIKPIALSARKPIVFYQQL